MTRLDNTPLSTLVLVTSMLVVTNWFRVAPGGSRKVPRRLLYFIIIPLVKLLLSRMLYSDVIPPSEGCFSDVREPQISKISPQMFLTKIVHIAWTFFLLKFFGNNVEHCFKPCYHMEFNTTNPNLIVKITICFTKTPKKPKHFRNLEK